MKNRVICGEGCPEGQPFLLKFANNMLIPEPDMFNPVAEFRYHWPDGLSQKSIAAARDVG